MCCRVILGVCLYILGLFCDPCVHFGFVLGFPLNVWGLFGGLSARFGVVWGSLHVLGWFGGLSAPFGVV